MFLEDPPFFSSQGERRKQTFNYIDLSTVCRFCTEFGTTRESSQREYTPKMQTILSLAQKYGCGVCDTIKAFAQSGMKYEALTVQDRTHLNDEGQKVYADAAYEAIVHLALEKSQTLPTANEYGCIFVDFQQLYEDYCQIRHSSYISWDRVHPNMIGATLMAKAFLEKCGFNYMEVNA